MFLHIKYAFQRVQYQEIDAMEHHNISVLQTLKIALLHPNISQYCSTLMALIFITTEWPKTIVLARSILQILETDHSEYHFN